MTSPFSPISPYQNTQPLAITHPDHNPFKPSGILPTIIYLTPPQPEPQARLHNEHSLIKERQRIRYSKLRDIIRFNSFFTLDIKDTDRHLTRTGNLTRTAKLLTKFYNLVKSQEIMLSEKKMVIGQSSSFFSGGVVKNLVSLLHIALWHL